ncbi:EthD domain-containing protein [Paracoccus sp. S-4012]|uniref:EthD domain-containing protein n=1 Tax=Paracoccus sp. S-4012 TaxID=2665648 RepID=UPI0018A1D053|nr:EthD domain-containing protein [Paracoccus sp. S-4012]
MSTRIKITYAIYARPDLEAEEVRRLWMDEHGNMLRRHARTLGIVRYVQTLHTPHPSEQGMAEVRGATAELPFGTAELYWESLETYEASVASREGRQAYRELLEDERRFASHVVSSPWLGKEREVDLGWSEE